MNLEDFTELVNQSGLTLPEGARGLLISQSFDDDNVLQVTPVERGKSIVNLNRDLLHHLNDYPHSIEWLTQLRNYCDSRIAAKLEAGETGRFVVPNWQAQWEMFDTPPATNQSASQSPAQ